jgi:uncharacterized protein YjlB
MVQIDRYFLSPTKLIPNSPYPLLHYRGFLSADATSIGTQFYDLLSSNGWQAQWIFRYGETQKSHYHSQAHECMVVLTGQATIRFGVADTSDDMQENTHGDAKEEGGIELEAHAGDVFIIPAGVAHKTFDTKPAAPFKRLSPGDGHGVPADFRDQLDGTIELSGFTMMGSYPADGGPWDFAVGGEGAAVYADVWSIPPPKMDPMLGNSKQGLRTLWSQRGFSKL